MIPTFLSLDRMFAEGDDGYIMTPSNVDKNGAYLIDRSPTYFEPILNYLRNGQLIFDNNVNPEGRLCTGDRVIFTLFMTFLVSCQILTVVRINVNVPTCDVTCSVLTIQQCCRRLTVQCQMVL
jgi:hypothetical protein